MTDQERIAALRAADRLASCVSANGHPTWWRVRDALLAERDAEAAELCETLIADVLVVASALKIELERKEG